MNAQPDMSGPLAAAEQLLNAMRKRDTTAIRAVVHPTLRVSTALDASGGSVLSLEGDDFVKVVGRATGPPWNQRLLSPEVRVDGTLATVWSLYRFDRGEAFDHCGAIALHLMRIGGVWKITQLSDTHRQNNCGRD